MKKICLYALMLCSSSVSAQVTLTLATHGVSPGVTSSVFQADTTGFNPGPSGAAQTWNFAGLSTMGSANTSNYVDPASTPYAAMYSGATVANGNASSGYSYYMQSTADLSYIGGGDGSTNVYYFDPAVIYKFPFTYGNINIDNFAAYYSGVNRIGSMTLDADAYGTLNIPSGSYAALRIKSIENYTDSAGSVVVHVNVLTYNWYTASERFPVLQYSVATVSGSTSSISKQLLINQNVVGINEISGIENPISVYPNPAINCLTVSPKTTNLLGSTVSIVNMLGQTVMSSTLTNISTSMDISSLDAGVYFIAIRDSVNYFNIKFIKQ